MTGQNCQCGAEVSVQQEHCPSCGNFLGFPNVRLLQENGELNALEDRWSLAIAGAKEKNLSTELSNVESSVSNSWKLVVAIPLVIGELLIDDPKSNYVNYEALVGSGARQTAKFADDSQRRYVAGALFGSFGEKVVYGALAPADQGLATYGDLFCTLKDNFIQHRTTFLEQNSYEFVQQFGLPYPPGYRSDWDNKGKLAAIKMFNHDLLREGYLESNWAPRLFKTDGKNRHLDEFVEGHLFGTFNLHSVERLTPRSDLADDDAIVALIEAFEALRNE